MPTKCIVIEAAPKLAAAKPIEFLKYQSMSGNWGEPSTNPKAWDCIELIAADWINGQDLMFAYNISSGRTKGVLYTGKWNDGVVE